MLNGVKDIVSKIVKGAEKNQEVIDLNKELENLMEGGLNTEGDVKRRDEILDKIKALEE